MRRFFDGLNIFIIVEYLLRVAATFVHYSLLFLLLYVVIYLFIRLSEIIRIIYLFSLFIFSLVLISHLILCILCAISYKPIWNKSVIIIIILCSTTSQFLLLILIFPAVNFWNTFYSSLWEIIENIAVFANWSRFPVKLIIGCFPLGLESRICWLLNLLQSFYSFAWKVDNLISN